MSRLCLASDPRLVFSLSAGSCTQVACSCQTGHRPLAKGDVRAPQPACIASDEYTLDARSTVFIPIHYEAASAIVVGVVTSQSAGELALRQEAVTRTHRVHGVFPFGAWNGIALRVDAADRRAQRWRLADVSIYPNNPRYR